MQVLILIVPLFIYQVFWIENRLSSPFRSKNSRLITTILCCTGVVLCMTFAIPLVPGYIFDFRMIPLIIAVLYGGYVSGIITALVLILYRFFLGEFEGFCMTVFFYTGALIIAFLLAKKYRRLSRFEKTNLVSGFVFSVSLSIFMALLLEGSSSLFSRENISFFFAYLFVQVFAAWFVIFFIENMNEKVRLNLEKIQREEMLIAIGELAASVAHEVRNPLMVVRGFIQLMQEEKFIPEHKREYFNIAIQELDRAQEIINDYLALAKSQKDTLEPVDVKKVIRDVIEIMSAYAALRGVAIHDELKDHLIIKGNQGKIKQVLMNILKNAIEAVPRDGTVRIRTSEDEEQVLIDIMDTGAGMSPEQMQQIGTPFYTTKDHGTGLGLMVSYRIMQSMNGRITVQSERDQGTKFTLYIPKA